MKKIFRTVHVAGVVALALAGCDASPSTASSSRALKTPDASAGDEDAYAHNAEYLRYVREAEERRARLPIRHEGVATAVALHDQINRAYLAEVELEEISRWEAQLDDLVGALSREVLTVDEVRVVSGIVVDTLVRAELDHRSLRTSIPSLRHLEECGIDATFGRLFARHAEARALRDENLRAAALLELQHALSCMSADQADAYGNALGEALAAWRAGWTDALSRLPEEEALALRAGFLNPALLVFDALKYRGFSPLYEELRLGLREGVHLALRADVVHLFDIFAGRLIEFDGRIVAELLGDLLDPHHIGTGQCGFSEMTASAVANGHAGCGRGVRGCLDQHDGQSRRTAFGLDHESLLDNCAGAGGGSEDGGGGGGPIAGDGYGACVISTMLDARNAGNRGYANCMVGGAHGRLMADLGERLSPLDGIHANPECSNPLMSDAGVGAGADLPEDWRDEDFDDVDPVAAADAIMEAVDEEAIDALGDHAEVVADSIETKFGRCVAKQVLTELYGDQFGALAETCAAAAAGYVRGAVHESKNSPEGLASGSMTLGTTSPHTGQIHIDLAAHDYYIALQNQSWQQDHGAAYVARLRDTLFHEGLSHAVSVCGHQHSMTDDYPRRRQRTEDAEHTAYNNALEQCYGSDGGGERPSKPTSIPQTPHGPRGDSCSPYAESMAQFMRCTGFLAYHSGRSGLDADGNIVEGGVLDPSYGTTLPQDPYSGAYDKGALACHDESLATGVGGRLAAATDRSSEDCKVMLCEPEQDRCPCTTGEEQSLPFALADKASLFGSALCAVSDFCLDDPHSPSDPVDPDALPAPDPGCVGLSCGVDALTRDFHQQQL
jgi:hypothetical protein